MQALRNLLHFYTAPSAPPILPAQRTSAPAVPHTRQGAEWDCGLACLLSLLTYHHIPASLPHLRSLLSSNSIWTIDVLALLSHYTFRATLYTTYTGANPSHSSKQFYSTQWHDDSQRITRLFQMYDTPDGSGGVRVERRSLAGETMYDWVEAGRLVLPAGRPALPALSTLSHAPVTHTRLTLPRPLHTPHTHRTPHCRPSQLRQARWRSGEGRGGGWCEAGVVHGSGVGRVCRVCL